LKWRGQIRPIALEIEESYATNKKKEKKGG
jgi:hypothetical protein